MDRKYGLLGGRGGEEEKGVGMYVFLKIFKGGFIRLCSFNPDGTNSTYQYQMSHHSPPPPKKISLLESARQLISSLK